MQDDSTSPFRIPLYHKGEIVAHALVDAADAPELIKHRWRWHGQYAVRSAYRAGQAPVTLYLHCVIFGSMSVDHINRDRLDMRRSNLRASSNLCNAQNRSSHRGSSSQFRGVAWNKASQRWQAYARYDGFLHHLGFFDDERQAADAARQCRAKHMPFAID